MHTVVFTDVEGNVARFAFPTATRIIEEPVMDGFEDVAQAAAHEADMVMVEDWLAAHEAEALEQAA